MRVLHCEDRARICLGEMHQKISISGSFFIFYKWLKKHGGVVVKVCDVSVKFIPIPKIL